MSWDEIKCQINDWETHKFLAGKELEQGQQHDPILQVLKQVGHYQGWYSLHSKQGHRLDYHGQMFITVLLFIAYAANISHEFLDSQTVVYIKLAFHSPKEGFPRFLGM